MSERVALIGGGAMDVSEDGATGCAPSALGGVADGCLRVEAVASAPLSEEVAGCGSPDVSGLISVWYPLRHV